MPHQRGVRGPDGKRLQARNERVSDSAKDKGPDRAELACSHESEFSDPVSGGADRFWTYDNLSDYTSGI